MQATLTFAQETHEDVRIRSFSHRALNTSYLPCQTFHPDDSMLCAEQSGHWTDTTWSWGQGEYDGGG